jgi:putative hydrolase of the HAD superfamily
MKENKVTTLFLDIGGVLLTNGWDHSARHRATVRFKLENEEKEINERHHLTFDTYESGKLSIDEYLTRTIFYSKRKFSRDAFKAFMFEQSQPIKGSMEFFTSLKKKHQLKIIAVSNEAREINEFRIKKYKLDQLFNGFVSSCYVHLRKPDADIFRMACDIAQTPLANILYIDDRLMFVEVARTLHIRSYHFQGVEAAKAYMKSIKMK